MRTIHNHCPIAAENCSGSSAYGCIILYGKTAPLPVFDVAILAIPWLPLLQGVPCMILVDQECMQAHEQQVEIELSVRIPQTQPSPPPLAAAA